ncbi:MAG: hypothetical protein AAGJ28_06260 [Pseudomonadota bacterium]
MWPLRTPITDAGVMKPNSNHSAAQSGVLRKVIAVLFAMAGAFRAEVHRFWSRGMALRVLVLFLFVLLMLVGQPLAAMAFLMPFVVAYCVSRRSVS